MGDKGMQRLIHPKKQPHNRRGPARWTLWEIALITLSVLLIVFPLYAEVSSWLNPLIAPAAPRLQQPEPSAASPQPAEPSPASAASPQPAEPSPVQPSDANLQRVTSTTAPTAGSGATATTVPPT